MIRSNFDLMMRHYHGTDKRLVRRMIHLRVQELSRYDASMTLDAKKLRLERQAAKKEMLLAGEEILIVTIATFTSKYFLFIFSSPISLMITLITIATPTPTPDPHSL